MNVVFEALAHPIRREILELLKSGSRSAGELADKFEVSKPTMSGHFAKLKEAGLIHAGPARTDDPLFGQHERAGEVLLGFMGTGRGQSAKEGEAA
jgi:DNA-binding transcriptional ArsR family regulator